MRETSKAGKHKSKSKQGRRKERGFVVFAFFLALLALVFFVFVFLPSFWLWWLLNGPLHPFGPCNSNSFCRAVSHRPLDCSSQPFFWWFVDFSCCCLFALRVPWCCSLCARLTDASKGKYEVTLNDIIIKASAVACRRVPAANSSWQGATIRL